jgi:hypothetical protein
MKVLIYENPENHCSGNSLAEVLLELIHGKVEVLGYSLTPKEAIEKMGCEMYDWAIIHHDDNFGLVRKLREINPKVKTFGISNMENGAPGSLNASHWEDMKREYGYIGKGMRTREDIFEALGLSF